LCGVRRIAGRRVDFSEKNAKTGVEYKRIAVVSAHDAALLAALQLADLRAAGGKQKRDEG
jgi:hypothetical protein